MIYLNVQIFHGPQTDRKREVFEELESFVKDTDAIKKFFKNLQVINPTLGN